MADPGATPRSRTCQRLSGWGSETEPGRRSRGERDTRRRRPESSVAPGVRGAFCEALVRDALGVARVGDTRDSPRTVRKETRDRKRTGTERTDGPFSDADSAICNARPFPASAASTSRSRPSPRRARRPSDTYQVSAGAGWPCVRPPCSPVFPLQLPFRPGSLRRHRGRHGLHDCLG